MTARSSPIRVRLYDPLDPYDSRLAGLAVTLIDSPRMTVDGSRNALRKLRKRYLSNIAAIDRALGEP